MLYQYVTVHTVFLKWYLQNKNFQILDISKLSSFQTKVGYLLQGLVGCAIFLKCFMLFENGLEHLESVLPFWILPFRRRFDQMLFADVIYTIWVWIFFLHISISTVLHSNKNIFGVCSIQIKTAQHRRYYYYYSLCHIQSVQFCISTDL